MHLDLSPKDLLASSSGDGSIRIWQLDDDPKVVKVIDGASVRINEFAAAKVYSTPTFDPTGNFLAYPKDSNLIIVDTSSWETKFKLSNDEITGAYSTCSISFCGTYIAGGSLNGEISIWNFVDRTKLKGQYTGEEAHSITSIAWSPKNNGELAFCDSDGQLSTILAGSAGLIDNKTEEEEGNIEDYADDIYGGVEIEDDDNENCVSLERLKNETMKDNENSDDDDDDKTVKSMTSVVPYIKPFQLQPPFQPGSTPIHLEHRFMVS